MESIFAKNRPIISSLLDTDYYKITMLQAVLHQLPNIQVEYKFIVRSKENLTHLIPEVREELEHLANLQVRDDELRFVFDDRYREYLTPDVKSFLRLFRFDLHHVHVSQEDGQIAIRVRGPMAHTILFEIPLLAIVSELRNRTKYPDVQLSQVRDRLYQKFEWLEKNASKEELADFRVSDFSTRRRLSQVTQREVVEIMRRDFPGIFVGTSNPALAYEFNLPLIGTMAHEWLMVHQQADGRLVNSQKAALENWVREFRGRLGIALTDTISSDYFLNVDFDLYFGKLFDGLRQDSGDAKKWADKVIQKYKNLKIDCKNKELMFSDSLNFEKALDIYRHVDGRARAGFGIGTSLACDVDGVEPLSIVMKLVRVHGAPVVKFSDDPVKNVCEDASFLNYAASVFGIKEFNDKVAQ
jgi:nicotinate phosphoribosyltransferase